LQKVLENLETERRVMPPEIRFSACPATALVTEIVCFPSFAKEKSKRSISELGVHRKCPTEKGVWGHVLAVLTAKPSRRRVKKTGRPRVGPPWLRRMKIAS